MRGRRRGNIAAADVEAAVDVLGLDDLAHHIEGGLHLAIDRDRLVRPELLQEMAEVMLEGASDETRVAGAGALAEHASLEDGDAASGARQHQRGIQSRESGAHDRRVDLPRNRHFHRLRSRRRLPPIGGGLELTGELIGSGHREHSLRSMRRAEVSPIADIAAIDGGVAKGDCGM